jgi:hypothetical protein
VLARPEYFLDLFLMEAPEPRRFDWLYRNVGSLYTSLPLTEYPGIVGEGQGYQHIDKGQRATSNETWQAEWRLSTGGLALFAPGVLDGEVLTGMTPGNPPTDQAVTLIQRCFGKAAIFFTLFHPYGDAPTISAVEWVQRESLEADWMGCRVTQGGRREQWQVRLRPGLGTPDWFAESSTDDKFSYALL